jgi:hypothetical protein
MELIRLIFRPEIIALLIPLSAIFGGFYLAALKLKANIKANAGHGLSSDDKQLLGHALKENEEIKNRLKNLEAIITSMDKELLALKAADDSEMNQKRVQEISEKMGL